MACLSMARREWSHTDRLQMRGNEHNKPAKCQHRLTRSCWLSCCESRRFGVDWWESDPNCPSHNSIGIAKNVLRYKGMDTEHSCHVHESKCWSFYSSYGGINTTHSTAWQSHQRIRTHGWVLFWLHFTNNTFLEKRVKRHMLALSVCCLFLSMDVG